MSSATAAETAMPQARPSSRMDQRLAVGDLSGGRGDGSRGGGGRRLPLPQLGADGAHERAEDDDADQTEEDGPNAHGDDESVWHGGSFLLQKLVRGSSVPPPRFASENVNIYHLRKDI